MPLKLFLNELSAPAVPTDRTASVGYLRQLVATIRRAHREDPTLVLSSTVKLADFPLGGGETVTSVRYDRQCKEESLYLKRINDRAPCDLAAEKAPAADSSSCEYKLRPTAPVHPGEEARGLGFAHLLGGLGLSLESNEYWQKRWVELDLTKLDDAANLVTTQIEVPNVDSPAGIEAHIDTIHALLEPENPDDGAEIWERRGDLFPNLVFIPRTQQQLQGISHGDPRLKQIWIKLRGIDQAIMAWKITNGSHPMFSFNVRPESRTRRHLTRFEDAEGQIRTFSDHCDFAPTEGRVHFSVETNPYRHALIGHIGKKLGIG